MSSVGIDFLGRRSWRVSFDSKGKPRRHDIQSGIPSAIMPIRRQETLLAGRVAEEHRRGRGLVWPVEAQAPVFGEVENGCGRVPLAAVFERLAKAETVWGKLGDCRFYWRPEGNQKSEVDAARIVSAHIGETAEDSRCAGLVVPDSLGIAGQQAVISAYAPKKVILVPRSIAVALEWCRRNEESFSGKGSSVGYLVIADLSLGAWSVAAVPLVQWREEGDSRILPVHMPKLKRIKLEATGWGMLMEATGGREADSFGLGWGSAFLSGEKDLPQTRAGATSPFKARMACLAPFNGNGSLSGALAEVRKAVEGLPDLSDHGDCLGVLITGALASLRIKGKSVSETISNLLPGASVSVTDETAAADGAAMAAYGVENDEPTWLELVEPLDIYYIGKTENGDPEQAWLPLLEERRIKAGSEHKNKKPIGGLKLQTGHTFVQIILRRPSEKGGYEFRKIDTTQGKRCDHDIPLVVNFTARPGQGFAEVRVESRERGLFESKLDWEKMDACAEPAAPKLSYIPQSVELKASVDLWMPCVRPLKELHAALRGDRSPDEVIAAARSAISRFNKALLAEKYSSTFHVSVEPSEYNVYTPMGRSGELANPEDEELLESVEASINFWIRRNSGDERAHTWLKKVAGWWYLRCPSQYVQDALSSVSNLETIPTGAELHIAGLCVKANRDIARFYRGFCRKIAEVKAPNNWLKALRNIVKFNEHALRDVEPEQARALFGATTARLGTALEGGRPLIAQNSIEALIFMLKRRRYESGFAAKGSDEYKDAYSLARRCTESRYMRSKGRELARKLVKFLGSQGEMSDIGTLLVDEDEDEE